MIAPGQALQAPPIGQGLESQEAGKQAPGRHGQVASMDRNWASDDGRIPAALPKKAAARIKGFERS
jgi:hypothetical protein